MKWMTNSFKMQLDPFFIGRGKLEIEIIRTSLEIAGATFLNTSAEYNPLVRNNIMVCFITKSCMQSKFSRVAEGIDEVILADKCA